MAAAAVGAYGAGGGGGGYAGELGFASGLPFQITSLQPPSATRVASPDRQTSLSQAQRPRTTPTGVGTGAPTRQSQRARPGTTGTSEYRTFQADTVDPDFLIAPGRPLGGAAIAGGGSGSRRGGRATSEVAPPREGRPGSREDP